MAAKVTVGVCGGVAAYRAAELVRALQQRGLEVHVVMTQAAAQFVRPLTFQALTGHKVISDLWAEDPAAYEGEPGSSIEHIAEAQTTRLLVVAPATANTLAKFAHGLADDFLSTLYLATTAPVVLAPAMNVNMWNHAATRANVALLKERGVTFVEPESGYLACGMVGGGRLAAIESIVDAVMAKLEPRRDQAGKELAGETVLITAGGTREPLDPVRFLGNRSSGRMGYALARAALERGARVILVSAPSALAAPTGCSLVPVVTAAEMQAAVLHALPQATIVIAAAAVSDFRPACVSPRKLKRTGAIALALEPTEDIVAIVAEQRQPGTTVIAFAAETEDLVENARAKLTRKRVDAIVANDVSQPGIGFESERNAALFITPDSSLRLPESSKDVLAERLLDEIASLRVDTP